MACEIQKFKKNLALGASLLERSHDPKAVEYFHEDVTKQDEVTWRAIEQLAR